MEDAGKAVDKAGQSAATSAVKKEAADDVHSDRKANIYADERESNNHNRRKRKADYPDARQRFGSRGGRNDGKRHQKGDMGRGEYLYVIADGDALKA